MSVGTRRDLFLGRLFFGRARVDEARPAVAPSPTPEPATRTPAAPATPDRTAADGPECERQDVVPLRPIAPDPTRTPPPSPALARLGAARPARPVRAGTFAIQTNLCLAWQNVGCSTCRERCPVPNVVRTDAGRPTIDPAGCTGCGECVARCPAPILAIRFVPSAKGGAHG
jgi:Pyruvate/2-oxoacid:ferredoxin oxidoreductase delta subunit